MLTLKNITSRTTQPPSLISKPLISKPDNHDMNASLIRRLITPDESLVSVLNFKAESLLKVSPKDTNSKTLTNRICRNETTVNGIILHILCTLRIPCRNIIELPHPFEVMKDVFHLILLFDSHEHTPIKWRISHHKAASTCR